MVYVYLPLMVLPLYASMEKLDFRLVEAAYDLYATPFKVLRKIIIPLVKPGIIAGSILVFIPALGAYVTPSILGGGKNLMLGNLIELQFGQGRNWPLGSALSITLMLIVMVGAACLCPQCGISREPAWLRPSPSGVSAVSPLSRWPALLRSTCRSPCWSSIRSTPGESLASFNGISLRWFSKAFQNQQVIDASLRSLQIASGRRRVATIAATMAALATTRTEPYRGLTLKYAFINQPLMIPEIVTAVALLIFFARIKIWTGYSGLGYLIAAHTAFCIPVRLSADPGAAGEHGPDAGEGCCRSLCDAMECLPLRHAAASVAGHSCRLHAGLRDLAGRCGHHRIRQVGRPGYLADLHARPDPPLDHAGNERDLDAVPALSVCVVAVFFIVNRKRV
jgi:ABC-type spermidine/putrescine transport system permease subunit I